MSADGLEFTYSAIFAAFLSAASTADAHWYSMKFLSEDIPSLQDLLGISNTKLNEILVLGSFGSAVRGGGFRFLPEKFKNFLVMSGLGDYSEHTLSRVSGFSKSQHFIRVGSQKMSAMPKPGAMGLGPRIRDLRNLQSIFGKSVASKTTQVNGRGGGPQDRSNSSASTTVESVPVPTDATVRTRVRMKSLLLPLILKQEVLDSDSFWEPVGDSNKIVSIILDIAKDLQEQKEDKLSEILGTTRAPMSPQSKTNPNKYPILKQLGVSLEDRRVHQSLLSELYHLGKKHDNSKTLYCDVGDNKLSSFVFVPSSKDFGRLKVNENTSKWFGHVLTALGGAGNENTTLVDLLTHIGRKEEYGDAWKEAVELNGHSLLPRLGAAASFAVQSACNMNHLRRQKRRRAGGITEEMRAIAEEELDDIASERIVVQDAVDMAKVDSSKMKTLFAEEKRKEENCKGTGQPLHAEIDSILKRHGIDRAAQFGGALAGNGCRRLMSDATPIINEIQAYIFALPEEQRLVGTNEQIEAVCEQHKHLLLCLDGYFSGMRTKRFHLTAEITAKTLQFRDRSLAIMRHLSMSVTPKDHCIEDHSIQLMILHEGIGDLGEDPGEHNHQLESKEDLRLGNVRCFRRKEMFKSKQDGKRHGPGVQEKMSEMLRKNAKRATLEQTAARHAEKRQKRVDAREEPLLLPAPVGLMTTMRQLRK